MQSLSNKVNEKRSKEIWRSILENKKIELFSKIIAGGNVRPQNYYNSPYVNLVKRKLTARYIGKFKQRN